METTVIGIFLFAIGAAVGMAIQHIRFRNEFDLAKVNRRLRQANEAIIKRTNKMIDIFNAISAENALLKGQKTFSAISKLETYNEWEADVEINNE